MKKLLILTVLLGTVAFGATTTPVTNEAKKVATEVTNEAKKEATTEVKKEMREKGKMMLKHMSEGDQAKFKANREEIMNLRKAEKPDWDKIQKLSDENALLGSKARVEMMKANPNMTMKEIMKDPATK